MSTSNRKSQRSYLRFPLDQILGSEGRVRVLRILCLAGETGGDKTVAAIARAASLSWRGTQLALDGLLDLGLVQAIDVSAGVDDSDAPTKRKIIYRLHQEHALASVLRGLFKEEHAVYSHFNKDLQRLVISLSPPPIAVWVEGDFLASKDEPGSGVTLSILGHDRDLHRLKQQAHDLLRSEKPVPLGLDLQIKTLTKADLLTGSLPESYKVIFGLTPLAILNAQEVRPKSDAKTHRDLDAISLARGEAIARSLSKNPEAVATALARLDRYLQTAAASEKKTLDEWRQILSTGSLATIKNVLSDPGERGTRLRQSNPFFSIDLKK